MSTAHTQGPWHVNYRKFSNVLAENGALIAKCNKLTGLAELEANARLIAAAPELLAALIEAEKIVAQHLLHSHELCAHMQICAVIAKARGKE